MFNNVNQKKLKSIVLILFLFNGFFIVLLDFSFLDGIFKDLFPYGLKTSSSERIGPDGVTFTLTELTGAYTDVDDDPDSPDGLWLTASGNNVNTAVLGSFSTPSGTLTVGADLQEFRVLVRQYDEGQTGAPDARIELWENGALVRAGSDTSVPDGGIVLSFTWNANELGTSDGSLVECKVVGTKAGGAPGARNTVEVGAIEWNAEISATDTDPPTWDTLTESADPLELGNTETININVYDASTISFVYLEFDSVNHTMSYISGDNWRYSTWTPTSVGIKTYEIHMIDEHGNTATTGDQTLTVEDTTDPTISNIGESADPLELGNTETITVDITDESSMEFVYLEFSSSNHSMSFVSGVQWEYTSWTPTSVGNYPYTIWANDTEGNIASDTSGSITVEDTTDPVISNVQESSDPLELGSSETIQCDVTDESTFEFIYLEFEGSNHSMSFVSGDTYEYVGWQPISVGVKDYTIWANDTEENIAYLDGSITVEDTSNPAISNIVESADPLELGNTETIECDITDESEMYFVYLEFGGSNHSMSLKAGITWEYTTWVPTSVGNKPYTIWANDTEGNIASSAGSITVKDTIDPVIDNVLESADPLELGATESIECDITDESEMYFVYLEFDGSNHSMSFVSGIKWEYASWLPTSVGVKNYKIWANDTSGNIVSYSSDITVEDTTNPVINNVIESADPLELGNTETIECDITDESDMYFVYLEFDGTNHSMSIKAGITWEYTTWTPTSTGTNNYKIWANDTEGNVASYSGSISVEDTTDPVISNVVESADPLEFGQTESIECDIDDESTMYFVYIEIGGVNYSMSIKVGITWEYTTWTPTSVGLKTYKIWANDTEGNINSYSSDITVEDTTDPVIDNVVESADPLELGQTETIECDITDESSMEFVYIEIGGVNYSMSFKSGITWEYTTWTPSSVGLKTYKIWANDTEGNINSYSSDITVEDTIDPVIDNVVESADPLELGQTETIECDVTDQSDMYFVYLEFDGSNHSMSIKAGITWEYTTWTPSSIGIKNYKIWANDTVGNIVSYSGSITVEDTTDPAIGNVIESADPLQLGNIETITCDITDESDMYFVYLEFEGSNHSMSFVSGITWEYNSWQPPSTGDYPYTIWANDTEGNINYYEGSINVIDEDLTPPTWDNLVEISDPLEFGDTITIRINTTDSSGISSVLIEYDGSNHSMTQGSGDLWYYNIWQPSSVGIKYYTIFMNDTFDNWNNTGQQDFTVQDTTNPNISGVSESADPLELGATETIQCDITDLSTPFAYVYLEFDGSNHSMSFVSGDTWEYASWTPSSIGIKDYTIWVEDSEGNIAEYNGQITVQDTTVPTWDTLQESDDPLELGDNETISINAYDVAGIELIYLEYGGVNYSLVFQSGNTWSYSNWQPSTVGNKPYEIYIKDNNNNWNSTTGDITVQDTTTPIWSDLIEDVDPTELGNNITITINATDISGIDLVYLEFDGSNHSMTNIYGNTWRYTNWLPSTVGLKDYEIHIKDNNNNWNSTSGSITVQDTTTPTWSDLIESADPLEVGINETITINATDISGIDLVYLEFDGSNHSMVNIYGNTWQYTNWQPLISGIKNYEIHIKDNNGNWNSTSGDITVQDTVDPEWSDLTESDDPLELGTTETISINATDISGIEVVYLEFDGVNHTMTNIVGNNWRYSTWTPATIGLKNYKIWIKDNNGNWNSTTGSITVQDTTIPEWSNLIESADPLPLGDNETISIDVTDVSGINQVLLEFEGSNHTMFYVSGDTWRYTNWLPLSIGNYTYNVWFEDNNGLWNNKSGSIEVSDLIDTTPPTWNNLRENDDPIEFGYVVIICIDVFDPSGINQVLLEFEGDNHTMTYVSGNTWRYSGWKPLTLGVKIYIVYMEDNCNNWNKTSGKVRVVEGITDPNDPNDPNPSPEVRKVPFFVYFILFLVFCIICVVIYLAHDFISSRSDESTKKERLKKLRKKKYKKRSNAKKQEINSRKKKYKKKRSIESRKEKKRKKKHKKKMKKKERKHKKNLNC